MENEQSILTFDRRAFLFDIFQHMMGFLNDQSSEVHLDPNTPVRLFTSSGCFVGEFVNILESTDSNVVAITKGFSDSLVNQVKEAKQAGHSFEGKSAAYVILRDVTLIASGDHRYNMPIAHIFTDDIVAFTYGKE